MQYALVIVMVIALLLSGMVLYAGMSSKLQTRFDVQERLRDNAQSGLAYGKAQISELNYDQPLDIQLYEDELDKVRLEKKNWGAYDYLIAEVNHQNIHFRMMEMIGYYQSKIPYALYLADRGNALALCGKTIIKGNTRLPKRGVKRAYIAGQNFIGQQLVQGTIQVSEHTLPRLNTEFLDQLQKPYLFEKQNWESVDSLNQSFSDPPVYYFSKHPIAIQQSNLSGHIIIESTDSIFVSKNAQLNDVIIKSSCYLY